MTGSPNVRHDEPFLDADAARPLDMDQVDDLAREMAAGPFLAGPIRPADTVADGQHRLTALLAGPVTARDVNVAALHASYHHRRRRRNRR